MRPTIPSLLLAGALVLGAAACGESADPVTSPTDDTTDDTTTTPDPSDDVTDPAAMGDCSAFGLDADATFDGQPDEVAATATFLLDAAVRCDEQLLFTAATESETSLFFGNETPSGMFSLPEHEGEDPGIYEALARLLNSTDPTESPEGDYVVWPSVMYDTTNDAAWEGLVTSGLYTQEQVDELREYATDSEGGYLGWRIGIATDGTWAYFTSGD